MLARKTTSVVPSDPRNVEWSKQRVVLYVRHHEVRPAERKFGQARKSIQRWLKNFNDSDFEQDSTAKRGCKKHRGHKKYRGRKKEQKKKQQIVRGRGLFVFVSIMYVFNVRAPSGAGIIFQAPILENSRYYLLTTYELQQPFTVLKTT